MSQIGYAYALPNPPAAPVTTTVWPLNDSAIGVFKCLIHYWNPAGFYSRTSTGTCDITEMIRRFGRTNNYVIIFFSPIMLDNSEILPPGIDDTRNLECYASGGDENAWLYFSRKKYYTNAFIAEDGKVELWFYSRSNLNLNETSLSVSKVTFRIEEARLWDEQVRLPYRALCVFLVSRSGFISKN